MLLCLYFQQYEHALADAYSFCAQLQSGRAFMVKKLPAASLLQKKGTLQVLPEKLSWTCFWLAYWSGRDSEKSDKLKSFHGADFWKRRSSFLTNTMQGPSSLPFWAAESLVASATCSFGQKRRRWMLVYLISEKDLKTISLICNITFFY